ncbi:hypothetical protein [Arthrobacter sp. A5]
MMKTRDRLTLEGTLSDFDEYLRRIRGVLLILDHPITLLGRNSDG